MDITILNTIEKISQIEKEWVQLTKNNKCSLFLTYDYTLLLWQYFSTPADEPFIMVVREKGAIVGIAPFKVAREKKFGISYKTIRFIAQWHGDRPDIIAGVDKNRLWQAIYDYLHNVYTQWHAAVLAEQETTAAVMDNEIFSSRYYFKNITNLSVSYLISMKSSWEDYSQQLSRSFRKRIKRWVKKLEAMTGKIKVDHFFQPQDIHDGLDRFIALEETSWKKDAGIGISRDHKHKAFYHDLMGLLSKEDQASVFIMKAGDEDISGYLLYRFQEVVYASQVTYNPSFSKYSPGMLLRVELLQTFFESSYEIFDMMGMVGRQPKHKTDWATGAIETFQVEVYKKKTFLFPIIWAKKIKRSLSLRRRKGNASPS